MKVIFLKDVQRVGKKYDVKEISDGYATNFLFPNKFAEPATPKAISELEKRKKNIEIEKGIQENLLLKNLEEIKGKTVIIKVKADEKGHLFRAVHEDMIVEAMKTQNHADINAEFIKLPKPIKELGEFEIPAEILAPSLAGKSNKSSFKLIVERV